VVLAVRDPCCFPTPRPNSGSGVSLIQCPKHTPGRIAVVLLGLMMLAACGADDVAPPTSAERIVSLYPCATEILFAIGAGECVVARSKWCDYPREALALPALGDAVGTNAESILAMEPDLVLVGSQMQEDALAPLAGRMRIERAIVDDTAGVIALIERLGELVGTEASRGLSGSVAARLRLELALARYRSASWSPVSFVFVVQREPLIVAGEGSYVDELLVALGGENVAATAAGKWPTLSLETLVRADPAVILDGAMTEPGDFWSRLASRTGRIVRVTDTAVLRPGPRLPKALEVLEKHLRGESR